MDPLSYLQLLSSADEHSSKSKLEKNALYNKKNKGSGLSSSSASSGAPRRSRPASKEQKSPDVARFLAKRAEQDAEARRKRHEETNNLLQLRSQNKKSARAAKAMVQRTKSSNKSALLEARNDRDTAATLGCSGELAQCDEDDYGYESKEQSSMYAKLMAKFQAVPEDPMAKFSKAKKPTASSASEMSKVRDRVKERLAAGDDPPVSFRQSSGSRKRKQNGNSDVASSSYSANSQFKEPEVKKTRREIEEEAARKRRLQAANRGPPPATSFKDLMNLAQQNKGQTIMQKEPGTSASGKKPRPREEDRPMTKKQREEYERELQSRLRKAGKLPPAHLVKKKEDEKAKVAKAAKPESQKPAQKSVEKAEAPPPKRKPVVTGPEFHPAVVKSMKKDDKKRQASHGASKARSDVGASSSRSTAREQSPESPIRRGGGVNRIDSDYEDEADSEMDDFIDDSEDLTAASISAQIRSVFRYNPDKYRGMDDEDDPSMENNSFASLMKEEARSARIGLMEDLEDMKREEEENKRKMMARKQKSGKR